MSGAVSFISWIGLSANLLRAYMNLTDYFQQDEQWISFEREQASRFAKDVADDFNVIHDVDAKRFCVPGDLLFAVLLSLKGLHERMSVAFSGMVTEAQRLEIVEHGAGDLRFADEAGKEYVEVGISGGVSHEARLIEQLTRSYVRFSGRNFPHILVPMLKKNDVMINPDRPLVMYESMSLAFDRLDLDSVQLELGETKLVVEGKRGVATLCFNFFAESELVGHGEKRMLLSGLRPYEEEVMQGMVEVYEARRISRMS